MSFFSGGAGSSGAIVSKVTVKRQVSRPIAKTSASGSATQPRTNGSNGAIIGSKPSSSSVRPNGTTSSAIPRAAPSSSATPHSTASHKVKSTITNKSSLGTPTHRLSTVGSSTSSRSSTPLRKRRDPSPIRSETESDSESGNDSDTTSGTPTDKVRRKELNGKRVKLEGGSGLKKSHSGVPSGSSSANGSARASASATPAPGVGPLGLPTSIAHGGRPVWCLDKVDERGEWGRGWAGFVRSEECVRAEVKGWAGGKGDGNATALAKYTSYFPQEGFNKSEDGSIPSVEVLYPAAGCRERFVLLIPANGREYNPMTELRATLRIILDHYIPPSHQAIFGTLSDSLTELSSRSALPTPTIAPHNAPLEADVIADSHEQSGPAPPVQALSKDGPTTDGSGLMGVDATSTAITDAPSPPSVVTSKESIGDAIRRALAPNRRDGPGLVRALERYNAAMEALQRSGEMGAWLDLRSRQMTGREWSEMVERVNEMAYARVVGPYSNELEHHPKHPEEVAKAISGKEDAYGELRHSFMSQVIKQTRLGPDSIFVDLGSGVGNCVVQTALQAGCASYGVELLPVPSHCARLQLQEVRRRWAMFGLKGNLDVALEEGDMRGNQTVARWLAKADVVLVNNEVFPPSLNDDLKNMFLDLKDGARIVSLRPFVNEGFRMNESNCDSFDAIVKLSTHQYYPDWVSWKGDSGKYYVQKIDRSARRRFEEEMISATKRRR